MIKKIFTKKTTPLVEDYFSCGETHLEKKINLLQRKERKSFFLSCLLAVSLVVMISIEFWQTILKSQDLVVLHDSGNGLAWVTQQRGNARPNEEATRANIANYVRMRESYAASSFSYQYRSVNQQSSADAALSYRKDQSSSNSKSSLRQLGRDGIREIKIDDIIILPFKRKNETLSAPVERPFAEVHFTSIDMGSSLKETKIKRQTALISWGYRGLPQDPEDRLTNWMGFTVYYYTVGK
jgi:type IV secretory pathway component VirB8